MIVVRSIIKSNYPASASSHGGSYTCHVNAGDVLESCYHFSALNGAPSAQSVAGKWQFAPILLPGMDEDAVSATYARRWFDVLKTNAEWASCFVDEFGVAVPDWPTDLLNGATFSGTQNTVFCARKIRPPSGFLVRSVITPSFTGGTSPSLTHGQYLTQYSWLT